ncbi:MAG: RNA polymerase factor sigma-54 [Simkania sp.]|nr:RNA polymerase factor sigma-54 [Simkania sp.]
MEPYFTIQLRPTLALNLRTALEVLTMPLPQLVHWIEERIEENPLLSLDSRVSTQENATESIPVNAPRSEENTLPPSQEFDALPREKIPSTYRQRVTQTLPLVEKRDLFAYLTFQAREAFCKEKDLSQALELIAEIDEKGLLPSHVEDSVLVSTLQSFDPPGIAARSIQEALLLQLKRKPRATPLAMSILRDHYDDFLHQRIATLCRHLRCSKHTLRKTIRDELSSLSFAPASTFRHNEVIPWIPDLYIIEEEGRMRVEVNEAFLPRISFDARYDKISYEPSMNSYCRTKRMDALLLQKALKKRQITLFRLGSLLLKTQRSFFEGQESHPQPLSIEQTASILKLHRSTIGRAITDKVISTPRGCFSLAMFFRHAKAISSSVETALSQLIQEEDKQHPLSDEAIATHLHQLGYPCSRRTVAKYRNALHLPTARLRKL